MVTVATKPVRKATNLSVRADLLSEARTLGINLSRTFELALGEELKKERERRWREENRAAIDAYNRQVEERGLWSDGLRLF